MYKHLLLILIISVSLFSKPYLIVLSMDGFRWDYTQRTETPAFDSIAKQGVKAESLQPSFPSKTFPNHYSIATGCYPDNHGLVFNTFYDPDKESYYRIRDRKKVEDPDYYGKEPIWVTAEKQGLKTATLFWVGSEAPVMGISPSMWKKYDHNMPFDSRIDTVISWFNLEKTERPRLIMWYLHEPDSWGHNIGPDSPEMDEKIHYLDNFLGDFLNQIESLSFKDSINIIITSDHGMAQLSKKRRLKLGRVIKDKWIDDSIFSDPVLYIKPKLGYKDKILSKLKKQSHISAWAKETIPDSLHYGKNQRIYPIVVVADSSYSISWKGKYRLYRGNGTHGYNPWQKDMHGIFYAQGPAFKQNYQFSTFENIHIYSIMAKVLGLKPAETDGDINKVSDILIK